MSDVTVLATTPNTVVVTGDTPNTIEIISAGVPGLPASAFFYVGPVAPADKSLLWLKTQ